MNIGVLGSGIVAQTIGTKLVERGHTVMLGSRHPGKLAAWRQAAGSRAQVGSFAEAAEHGETLFNAASGAGALDALALAGERALTGKILIDISNPLDFSKGMPPSLLVCNTDSLGEQIQRAFPSGRVVKSLNTLNASLMVSPGLVAGGDHTIFVSGNDAAAKTRVIELLRTEFGWQDVIDLGDISTSCGVEILLPLWIALYGNLGSPKFQFKIVR